MAFQYREKSSPSERLHVVTRRDEKNRQVCLIHERRS